MKKYCSILYEILRRLVLFFKGFKTNYSSILLIFFSLIFTIPQIPEWLSVNLKLLYGIVIFIYILVIIWDVSKRGEVLEDKEKEISELLTENKDLSLSFEMVNQSLESLPIDYLSLIFNELGLNSQERISLYRYNNQKFYILGRYASVVPLRGRGRPSYEANKGFIGYAWRDISEKGYYHINKLPDFTKAKMGYISEVSKTGMSRKEIEELSMKSRCYYAKIIKDKSRTDPIGIIVIESLNEQLPIDIEKIEDFFKQPFGQYLCTLMKCSTQNYSGGEKNE